MGKTEWKPCRLDELGFVGRGKSRHRPRNDARLYDGPYPFIQTADIMGADPYITSYTQTYSEFGLQQSKLWPPNTLCMTIAGANTAETAILKFEACFPDSIVGFIPDQTKANIHFVKYSLDLMKDRFRAVTRGATQDNLSLDKLLSFPISTPPLPVQRQIAGILSVYDDLIENNTRRSKILEEMARAVYREWFVHFRFPGHHSLPLVSSTLDKIPIGWQIRRILDFAEFVRGVEPGSESYVKEPDFGYIRFLRVGDLSKRDSAIYVREELVRDKVLNIEDIAITLDGSVGLVRVGLSGGYSTGIRKVVIRDRSLLGWSFLYQLLNSESIQAVIHSHAKGTTIKHAGSAVEQMLFAAPPSGLIEAFEKIAAPMLRKILVLEGHIENLRRTRDLLLPKLISGEIDVDGSSIAAPQSVELTD